MLLERGAKKNKRNSWGNTPFGLATEYEHEDVAALLPQDKNSSKADAALKHRRLVHAERAKYWESQKAKKAAA